MAHNYIIQWNCRGLRSNREDIELLISKYSPAAICLQETMLKRDQIQTFKHYSAYYKNNINGHGGVCVLVKNNFIHSQVQFQADLQAVAVCITINKKTYTVASVYVPPSEALNKLAFDRMIKSFSSRYLVLGDFNGHSYLWGANQENERGKAVEHLIDSHNLILLNDSVHTRFDTYHQTSSLLDLSLCHPSIYMDVACEVLSDRLGSDHHPIIITANTSDHPVPERVPKWNFKRAKWDIFQDQCIKEITPNLFHEADDKMAIFSSTLLDIAADNIPKTSPFPKRKAKPWFDEDCQAAKKERNKANRLANKHPSAANSMRSRLIQARTKKVFKQKKRDSWKNYVSSVNVNTPSKKVWNMIRKITGKNVASPMHHIKDENGTLITDRVQIANTLGAAIEKSSSSENYSKKFQSIKAQKEKRHINFKTNKKLRYNKKFTRRDLKRSLKKSNNSSPGPDQIHYEILRHLPIETLHILLDIINETWKNDTFPESWKEALIISIPKPGKDHFNPLNYRPIALTSCICKTVERMVNERLVWYLEKNGLLAKQQCGYRANRSTVDHLIRLETFIRDAFIQNQHLVAVFFDLQKAYDTTWKHGIQQDLHDMGLRGNLSIFIGNFLTDRTFQIHLGTILSDVFHQEEGVPQGAILSTTLFNVKINDIVKQVDPGVECSLYVDDFVIMYKSPTIDAIQRKLQHTINRLEKWTLKNGFTISKNKTVAMHFCPDKKCMDPVLKLDNDPIQFVKEAKFLGLIWDTKLTFEPHIKYLKARCKKSLNILKVLSRTEWGADRTTLLKLYRSLVRSKLDYGCLVYGSASKTALAKLDPVHNQGLRLSLGAFRSSPVESLYVEAHEPPLEIRREKLALQYAIKLKANPGNPAYDVVFNPKYQNLYANKDSATDSFGIYCKKLLKEAKIDVGEIAINSFPDVPIWDSEPVTVDFTLSEFDKSSTSSTVFKSRFNEVKQKYLDFCHIYTDGSKVETKVASAYVCPYGTRGYRLRDGCSIFTAEVEAINKALTYVKVSARKNFVIFSDSMSVLQAIESQESKNPLVNRVLQACQQILSNGKFITFCWLPSHRDIRGNEDADRAAKDALSKAQPENFELPCTDVFMKIQPFILSLWQKRWDKEVGYKLHAIMPQIDDKYYSGCKNRKDEVIINRLRIGHTRLTHSIRMENIPHPPLCDQCEGDHELTVKHILIECNFLKIIRRRHYDVTDLNQLFKTVSSKRILDFVKDIGLYNSL